MSALETSEVPVRTKRTSLKQVPPVAPAHNWPKGAFPVLILLLLAAGMVGHLVLQTKIQDQGFELASLQSQSDQLTAQQSILQAMLDKQSSPQQLALAASSLGMVANPYSTFLTLPSGQVSGVDKPVKGDELPVISAPPQLTGPTPAPGSAQAVTTPADTAANPAAETNPTTTGTDGTATGTDTTQTGGQA